MPGDSPPRGAEEPALGASLALLPRAALYITNPQRLQRSPGGTGDGYSVLVCQVMHGDLRPHPEQQRVALPAPAWSTAVRPRARRGTGRRKPPHCPGSRSCCAALGTARSPARGAEPRPSRTLCGSGVLSVRTTDCIRNVVFLVLRSWVSNPALF